MQGALTGFFTAVTLAALLLAGPGTRACAAVGVDEKSFFPLMAWDYVEDEDTIRKMAECEVNMIAFVPVRLLDACQKHGVKAIVYHPSITPARWDQPFDSVRANKTLPALIKQVNSHPAVYGYHLKDEPGGDQFAELAKSAALVRELAPGKWPYINLPPGMGDWYENDYINDYVRQVKPPILSYDNYAIGERVPFSYGFWANIHDIRSGALRHNLPFWSIILTSGHWQYRVPNDADLRLQVYGSLVYGAKGVCFYKFMSGPLAILDAPDLGNFRGPLDEFGEKTQVWHHLRNVNRQVKNLGPYLLKLRSDNVYHIGEVPERNQGINDKSLVKSLRAGDGLVIGDFTHEDGSRWVMVVNKSLTDSQFVRPDFRIPVKSVSYVAAATGKLLPFPDPWYCLAPGAGVLLKLL